MNSRKVKVKMLINITRLAEITCQHGMNANHDSMLTKHFIAHVSKLVKHKAKVDGNKNKKIKEQSNVLYTKDMSLLKIGLNVISSSVITRQMKM